MSAHRIDALQYCNWSRQVFEEWRIGGLDAVHVTVGYHEDFTEFVHELKRWDARFREHSDLIMPGTSGRDVRKARANAKTAVFFGVQNPAPIGSDLGMLAICHRLGLRFMQLTYNLQSLCGAGWQETEDAGLTRFGAEVVAEMNRLGMVADLSHAGERTTLEAIDASACPGRRDPCQSAVVARDQSQRARHGDPRACRERRDAGILLVSASPFRRIRVHVAIVLRNGGARWRRSRVRKIWVSVPTCVRGQPDEVVRWMRDGRWTFQKSDAVFPDQPVWFRSNRDWDGIAAGLYAVGFSKPEVEGILGENWLRFWERAMATGR